MKILLAQRVAAAVACLGFLMPQGAFAGQPVAASAADIALRDGGLFVGQVVDASGKAMTKADVSIRQAGVEVATTSTDANGVFAAKGLNGGQYTVVAGGGQVNYRLWAANTAPPTANKAALVVTGADIANGQHGNGGVVGWVKNHPMIVAAGVAAAIAIPLAVADDDDPTS